MDVVHFMMALVTITELHLNLFYQEPADCSQMLKLGTSHLWSVCRNTAWIRIGPVQQGLHRIVSDIFSHVDTEIMIC